MATIGNTVYKFPAGKQVRNYHYQPEAEFLVSEVIPGGPYNGVVDPATGNLIVSMGLGVVVILPTGEANRVAVGPYAFVEINELSFGQRLNKEFVLALILGLLAVCIGSLPIWKHSRTRTFFLVMVVGATAVWLIYALLSREVGIVSFIGLAPIADSIQDIPPLAFCGWIFYLFMLGAAIVQIRKCGSWQLVRQLLEMAVASMILFLVPLIFWATGILPSYQLAIVIGVAMAIFPIQNTYRDLKTVEGYLNSSLIDAICSDRAFVRTRILSAAIVQALDYKSLPDFCSLWYSIRENPCNQWAKITPAKCPRWRRGSGFARRRGSGHRPPGCLRWLAGSAA